MSADGFVDVLRPGRVVGLYRASAAGEPLEALESGLVVAGVGVEGGRYATRRGLYSSKHHDDRYLTIIEAAGSLGSCYPCGAVLPICR